MPVLVVIYACRRPYRVKENKEKEIVKFTDGYSKCSDMIYSVLDWVFVTGEINILEDGFSGISALVQHMKMQLVGIIDG